MITAERWILVFISILLLSHADLDDFDENSIQVVFPADELMLSIPAPVAITDDEVDEADIQFFIVLLELVDATGNDLANTAPRNTSVCEILDNDG